MDDIVKLVGYDTIESDEVGTQWDCLYFDEECCLRGSEGRFHIDTMIPVSGKGVVVGTVDEGAGFQDEITDTDTDELRSRIKYL